MKVYVVTAGEYSDYRIEGVFLDQEKARLYLIAHDPEYGNIEEYDVIEDIQYVVKDYMRVVYNFVSHKITLMEFSDEYTDETSVDLVYANVVFYIHTSNKRLYKSIIEYGTDSNFLLKIAYDRLSQWKYEHGLSTEVLSNAHDSAWKAHYNARFNQDTEHAMNTLLFASTSSDTSSSDPADPVGAKLKDVLDKCIINGDPLPDETELQKMADEIRTAGCDEQ